MSGGLFLSGGACGCIFSRVVPSGTVQLFTDEAKAIVEAVALFDRGEIQSIDVHGVWISSWSKVLWVRGIIKSGSLWSRPPM